VEPWQTPEKQSRLKLTHYPQGGKDSRAGHSFITAIEGSSGRRVDLTPKPTGTAEIAPQAASAIEDIRERIKAEFKSDPEFAEMFKRPLAEGEAEHEVLDRARRGEFRR